MTCVVTLVLNVLLCFSMCVCVSLSHCFFFFAFLLLPTWLLVSPFVHFFFIDWQNHTMTMFFNMLATGRSLNQRKFYFKSKIFLVLCVFIWNRAALSPSGFVYWWKAACVLALWSDGLHLHSCGKHVHYSVILSRWCHKMTVLKSDRCQI